MELNEILDIVLKEPYGAFFYTPALYANANSYLFYKPVKVIEVNDPEDIDSTLGEAEELIKKGYAGYTLMSYESGYYFERRLRKHQWEKTSFPLMTFVFFTKKNVIKIASKEIKSGSQSAKGAYSIRDFRLNVTGEEYIENIQKIKKYIEEGDTYQVNYTIKGKFEVDGDLRYLFRSGVFNQSARYSAFINSADKYIISFSPELFFMSDNKKLITIPMKGTMRRGVNLAEDKLRRNQLQESLKDQAENLMIVDLLRNDMGRISRFGSVKVNKLFRIEKYETLYQMVSVISSVADNPDMKTLVKNLFPGGSITGAPKIRAMEIIRELEKEPRGIYTGAIGIFNKHKKIFNLPIRTLVIDKATNKGELGIGSGVVWDSDPQKEYEETLLKSDFLLKPQPEFEIFETMLIESGKIYLFDLHLERIRKAAAFFLFRFNTEEFRRLADRICSGCSSILKYRLKISLNKWGELKADISELNEKIDSIKVIVSDKRINSGNRFLYFKTSNRKLYSEEYEKYSQKGFGEVLFFNEKDELCEGSFTNIFIKKGDIWFTPPLCSGLLNGTYRQVLLSTKKCYKEKFLYSEDLRSADEVMLVNSLRKEIKVESISNGTRKITPLNTRLPE